MRIKRRFSIIPSPPPTSPPTFPPSLTSIASSCILSFTQSNPPIHYPSSKGPDQELYLAEEAVGLAKALSWTVAKGPFWNEDYNKDIRKSQGRDPNDKETEQDYDQVNGPLSEKDRIKFAKRHGWKMSDQTKIKDGQYVYTPFFSGVHQENGIIFDLSSESSDDLANEWRNKIIRKSIAKSSLVKVKKIHASNFFTKGKVIMLGEFIAENKINAVFINSNLTPLQSRNLERNWQKIVNGDTVTFKHDEERDLSDMDSDVATGSESDSETARQLQQRNIKIFDRFTIILQIFAQRAKTGLAKMQIELTFLNFAKTKLVRSGTAFQSLTAIFSGDLMSAEEIRMEVVSARQRRSRGKLSGSGETVLEMQKRLINEKVGKIKGQIEQEVKQRKYLIEKNKNIISTVPKIALIGYTNAGKSALLNCILDQQVVESKDLLFQTLSTTSKKIRLVTGQKAIMLDTIGFITDLPHEMVSSFMTTLEEVAHADLVLHIRDVSHPFSEVQKQAVLDVLKKLNFNQDFYTKRMIEVWNKIDLITQPINYDQLQHSDYPIVPISALMKTNINHLLTVIEDKTNYLLGKKAYTLSHSLQDHGDRIRWLYEYPPYHPLS